MSQIILKNVRCSFPHLFEPYGFNGQDGKYSMQIIMDKNHPQMAELKRAIVTAGKDKFPGKVKGNELPAGLRSPLRDGAEKADERPEYEGMMFFNSSSRNAPRVVDKQKRDLRAEDNVIYPGCYVNVNLNFYGYDVSGNKGIAAGLNAVQFKANGESLGGHGNVLDGFDVEEEEDDDIPFDSGASNDDLI